MAPHLSSPEADRAASASPIPPHLRPSASRHHSSSSVTSVSSSRSRRSAHRHPHNQQTQFVAGTFSATLAGEASPTAIQERALIDEAATRADHDEIDDQREGGYSDEDDDGEVDADSEADWNAAREGSISRRPAWRRPSPKWIYPFIVGAVLALGNAAPPRSELYVNLACLAHPPEAPASASWADGYRAGASGRVRWAAEGQGAIGTSAVYANTSEPALPPHTPRSAADEWFIRLQKEIYEYNRAHQHTPSGPTTGPVTSRSVTRGTGTTSTTHIGPAPTGPIPHPDDPTQPGREGDGKDDGSDRNDDDPATRGPPYREIDPALCKKSPTVQAAAAKLTMVMAVTGGVLAALTTGHWGRLSDKIGRTKILALCETGLMLYEISFITVATFPYLVPGGYRALVIGPTFEGLVGGTSTLLATVNAYVSDTTPDGSRATVFARVGGMAMTGFALGPILGSWIINVTGNIMVPFYISACVHAFFILYILLILPESLSSEARAILTANAKVKAAARKRKEAAEREWEDTDAVPASNSDGAADESTSLLGNDAAGASSRSPKLQHRASRMSFGAISLSGDPSTHSKRRKRWTGNAKRWMRTLTRPLQPLEVFVPTEKQDGRGRDWNMTFVAGAMFMMATLMGFIQIKAQYTFYKYGWTSAQLGPFLSIVSFSRGFVLIALIPLAMKLAKPFFVPSPPAVQTTEADTSITSASSPTSTSPPDPTPTQVKHRRPAILDLYTIRVSLIFESLMFLLLALSVSPEIFVLLSVLITFASGHSPAANSLALTLVGDSRQSGRLFGGIAVIQALGTSLVGPLMYGGLFSATVGTFAEGIFVMAAAAQFLAFVCFMCVRLPVDQGEEGGKAERGRSKKVKTTRAGSYGA